jgi:hypothetical protein
MNTQFLEQHGRTLHLDLQKRYTVHETGSNIQLDAIIETFNPFEGDTIDALQSAVQQFLEKEYRADFIDKSNCRIKGNWHSLSLRICPQDPTTLEIILAGRSEKSNLSKLKKKTTQLFLRELANTPMTLLKHIRIYVSKSLALLPNSLIELARHHFAISYNFLKGFIESMFFNTGSWDKIYSKLQLYLEVAGLGAIHRHIYLVEVNTHTGKTNYALARQAAKHAFQALSQKTFENNTPFGLAANFFHSVQNEEAFAWHTIQAKTHTHHNLEDAKYRMSSPETFLVELYIYGGFRVAQSPVILNGGIMSVMTYPEKYFKDIKEFWDKYGNEFTQQWKSIVAVEIKSRISSFLEKAKETLSKIDYEKWVKFIINGAKKLKHIYDLIEPFIKRVIDHFPHF